MVRSPRLERGFADLPDCGSDVPAETHEAAAVSEEISVSRDEAEQAVDDIIEHLDNLTPEAPVEKVKASPAILFLAQYFPPFWGFVCAGIAIAVVAGIHLLMALIMEHDAVVFEKAECVATYEVDTSIGYGLKPLSAESVRPM